MWKQVHAQAIVASPSYQPCIASSMVVGRLSQPFDTRLHLWLLVWWVACAITCLIQHAWAVGLANQLHHRHVEPLSIDCGLSDLITQVSVWPIHTKSLAGRPGRCSATGLPLFVCNMSCTHLFYMPFGLGTSMHHVVPLCNAPLLRQHTCFPHVSIGQPPNPCSKQQQHVGTKCVGCKTPSTY